MTAAHGCRSTSCVASGEAIRDSRRCATSFGFHLGDLDLYRAGLAARLAESDEHLFERGEGGKRHDGEFALSFNALLAGAKVDDAWVRAVTDMTKEAHTELPDQLHAVWVEVLRTADIPFEREWAGSAESAPGLDAKAAPRSTTTTASA